MIPETVTRALGDPALVTGLGFGVLALALGGTLGLAAHRAGRSPAPVAGLLLVMAASLAIAQELVLPQRLVVALALLAAAGGVAEATGWTSRRSNLLGLVLSVPGAWLMAHQNGLVPGFWTRSALAVVVVVGATLMADFDHRHRDRGMGPVLLAISAVGVYLTVPDTERALVFMATALPLAALGWPRIWACLGRAGAYAATGLLVWVASVDGRARPGAVVAAVACLGLFMVEPVARVLARHSILDGVPPMGWVLVPVILAQLALALFASRLASRGAGAAETSLIVASGLVAAVALAASFSRGTGRLERGS